MVRESLNKTSYDEFLEEIFDFALGNMYQEFYLHLFGEVVNDDD